MAGGGRVIQGSFVGPGPIQAKGGAAPVPERTLNLPPGASGIPLPETVRAPMERLFNTNFSGVRIFEGRTAQALGAVAFTTGNQIHFAPGKFQPGTTKGRQLLGHELAHVVQQRMGRVPNPLGSGIAVVRNPSLEAEADRMGGRAAQVLPVGSHAAQGALLVQRRTHAPGRVIQRSELTWGQTFTHYKDKLPHLFDLMSSHRRQKMLSTSTLARQVATYVGMEYIPVAQIRLLHAVDDGMGSKTATRAQALRNGLGRDPNDAFNVTAENLTEFVPSVDPIQVARTGDHSYVTLQGVGRLRAVQIAYPNCRVQVRLYTVPDWLAGQLNSVALSYQGDEGYLSKGFGLLTSLALIAGTAYGAYKGAPYIKKRIEKIKD